MGDQAGGRAQDISGRTVVALQTNDLGTGKVLFELQDVADFGATPAVNRLIVVTDTTEVLVPLGQQPEPEILRHVRILILVDQDKPEALMVAGEHIGMILKQRQAVQQQIAEITGVQGPQTLLIVPVNLHQPTVGQFTCFAPETLSGSSPRSFQRWITARTVRAGDFLSSIPAACSSCLIRRNWSSVSRIEKLG